MECGELPGDLEVYAEPSTGGSDGSGGALASSVVIDGSSYVAGGDLPGPSA